MSGAGGCRLAPLRIQALEVVPCLMEALGTVADQSLGSVQVTLFGSWAVSVGLNLMKKKQLSSTTTTTMSQTLAR